jgi:hypothetical protein
MPGRDAIGSTSILSAHRRIATSELGEGDVLDGRDVLPGFRQPLAELFRTLHPPA